MQGAFASVVPFYLYSNPLQVKMEEVIIPFERWGH